MFADLHDVQPAQPLRGGIQRLLRSVLLALGVLFASWWGAAPLFAANPPPVQVFYLPVPEDQAFTVFRSIFPGNTACGLLGYPEVAEPTITYDSISILATGTIIYYDHWEDGYEVDLANPVQATTEIWGDGDPSNGAPPNVPDDLLDANTVIILRSDVRSATRQSEIDYDGGDKFGASHTVAVTRVLWPSGVRTLAAGAVEVYPVDRWGTSYHAPVGTDTNAAAHLFEYSALAVMAADDGTLVEIDADADGVFEISTTLNEGQGYLTSGTVRRGAVVRSSAPVQVDLITGDICEVYETRWYALFSDDRLSSRYYSPVTTDPSHATVAYFYNPNTTPITVTRTIAGNAQTSVLIGPNEGASLPVVAGSAARFDSANGEPFAGLAAVDAGGTNQLNQNSFSDWGFTLIPDRAATMQTLIGLGIGRDPESNEDPEENASPVWVTPVFANGQTGPVNVCVDFDGDGQGDLIDANGFRYDLLLELDEFEVAKVLDDVPNDGIAGDQTGMLLYVCPSAPDEPVVHRIVAAWGQDPSLASFGPPGLDAGTTAPPAATFEAGKLAEIIDDLDGDGQADAGDSLRYHVVVRNSARVPIGSVTLSDTIPLHTSYIPGSTTQDSGSGPAPIGDNPSGSPFPLDEGGITLGSLAVGAVITVSFDVVIDLDIPEEVDRVRNVAIVRLGDEETRPEVETPLDGPPVLVLQKTTNGVDADEPPGVMLLAGEMVTWTYTITNLGTVSITSLMVTDSSPGVTPTFVAGDDLNPGIFDPGEVWTYRATGIAISGQYSNTGTAVGIDASGEVITVTDVSHYFGIGAAIDLEKVAASTTVTEGGTAFYTVTVTNPSALDLNNVSVEDSLCTLTFLGGDDGSDGILTPGEVWTYTCSRVLTRTTTNIATVTALDPSGNPVTDTDSVRVVVPLLWLPIIITPPADEPCPPPNGCELVNSIKALGVNQSGSRLYVSARNPDELLLVDPATVEILARTTAHLAQPWGVVVDEADNRVYVSNFTGASVSIYDATTLQWIKTIPVGDNPTLLEIVPDQNLVFALVRGGSKVAVIQGTDLVQVVDSGGSGPFGIAFDPVNRRLFVSHRDSHSLSMLREVNGSWQAFPGPQFDDERQLFELAYHVDTQRLFVVYADAASNWYLDVWEPRDNSLWGRLSTQPLPSGGNITSPDVGGAAMGINPTTGNLFNVNTGANSLSVVDTSSLGQVATVGLGSDPFALAVDGVLKRVYVGLRQSGNLVKLDDTY